MAKNTQPQQKKRTAPPPVPEVAKSKIIGAEWFMVILALVFVDIGQVILTALAVPSAGFTEVINEIIEFFIGPTLILYFYMRGVKLDWKVMAGICASWIGETIPGVQVLPLWSLDAGYVWFLEKQKEGGLWGVAGTVAGKATAKSLPKNPVPKTAPPQRQATNPIDKYVQKKQLESAKSQGLNAPPPIPTHEYNPLEQKPVVARDVKQIKPAPPKIAEPEQSAFKAKNKLESLGLEVDDSGYQKRMAEKNNNVPKKENKLSDEKFVGDNRRAVEETDGKGEYRGSQGG